MRKKRINFSLSGIADAGEMIKGFAKAAEEQGWTRREVLRVTTQGRQLINSKRSWMVIGLIAQYCVDPFNSPKEQ